MKILIAPDSFKESLEALDVCHAVQSGFSQVFPDADYKLLPMADGGEGTSAVLSYVLGGRWKEVRVHDPLMRPIIAKYLLLPNATAVIEVAQACGLHLPTADERNPIVASTYGVGELIADALEEGAKRIIIGLGGSATNDAGLGMLMALGITFHDINDSLLTHGGGALASLHKLDNTNLHTKISDTVFEVACDVTNPLCGLLGASAVFGPQKALVRSKSIPWIKRSVTLRPYVDSMAMKTVNTLQSAGAAGGLGYAMMTFFKAQLKSGFDTVAEVAHLSQHIAEADLVITGEGKLDAQTAMGKVAGGISQIAKASRTPVIAICGSVDGLKPAQTSQFNVVMPSIQKSRYDR
ncbi:glycerate kinase [Psychrobacter sp. KH172YL61]|uniref:glycerate kinase n=1 Tax=Psychrobacter sp. KH172YL61 TaxID=2517899 RepID=UPI0010B6AE40|nr:glycerate kinase [Psychrobacter sp. KH172YL61]BBI68370.1 glycerate kinase [Psychrobacter sp. KH172YL61]